MEAQETKVEDFVTPWLSPCPHHYADMLKTDIVSHARTVPCCRHKPAACGHGASWTHAKNLSQSSRTGVHNFWS